MQVSGLAVLRGFSSGQQAVLGGVRRAIVHRLFTDPVRQKARPTLRTRRGRELYYRHVAGDSCSIKTSLSSISWPWSGARRTHMTYSFSCTDGDPLNHDA